MSGALATHARNIDRGPVQKAEPRAALDRAVARAELLWRLGRGRAAAVAFLQAAGMTESATTREFLRRRGADLLASDRP
jgi:predicted RNA polymerase sigma factor